MAKTLRALIDALSTFADYLDAGEDALDVVEANGGEIAVSLDYPVDSQEDIDDLNSWGWYQDDIDEYLWLYRG